MTDDEAIARLSDADTAVVEASVRALVDRVRTGAAEDPVRATRAILALARHANAKVRQPVAAACEHLLAPFADEALTTLVRDTNAFVKEAAKRSEKRRAALRKAHAKREADDRGAAELRARIATKHSKAALRLADRLLRLREETVFRALHHEVAKPIEALEIALLKARSSLERGAPIDAARAVDDAWQRLELLSTLLQASRAFSEPIRAVRREENVAEVVREAKHQLLDRLGERASRVRFVEDVPPKLAAVVDRHRVLQALQNVLQNAVEAYPRDASELEVRVVAQAVKSGAGVAIAIEDRGMGMSEAERLRLFVPFQSTKPGGSGFGLLIARRMVEDVHGGELSVESEVGAGTTVTMTFPAPRGS